VTAGQYTAFLNAVAATDTYGLYNTYMDSSEYGCQITRQGTRGSYTYDFSGRPSGTEADWLNRPVNYVSYGDAMRFANWLHNGQPTGAQGLTTTEDGAYHLNGASTDAQLMAVNREADWKWAATSEDEWYKAAYYNPATGTYFDYPTASNTTPGRDMADASGNNANYYDVNTGYLLGSPYYRTEVGEFQNSASPYGTFDQGGNVWEWNEALVYVGYDSYRGLRGGSFIHLAYESLLASDRGCNYPTTEREDIGFRVSEVPEPASMALLAIGGIGMLLRRRGLRR
jgi:formylglycine-generating enzyme required for sulfatase activity